MSDLLRRVVERNLIRLIDRATRLFDDRLFRVVKTASLKFVSSTTSQEL